MAAAKVFSDPFGSNVVNDPVAFALPAAAAETSTMAAPTSNFVLNIVGLLPLR
jgi:hypothetical protein